MEEPEEESGRERVGRGRSDARRTERLTSADDDHEPVNPGWRSEYRARPGARRGAGRVASSPQEAMLWLQQGGWRFLAAGAGAIVVLLVLILFFRTPGSRPTALQPRATITVLAGAGVGSSNEGGIVAQPSVTAAPLPSPTTGPANFVVAGTDGQGLFLRADHSVDAQVIETLPDGTVVQRVAEDFTGPDRVWRQVRAPSGQEGWVAVEFLQPAP